MELKKSEIKKVIKAVKKEWGYEDATITGYSSSYDKLLETYTCEIELCHGYSNRIEQYGKRVYLYVTMFDRRRSFVSIY